MRRRFLTLILGFSLGLNVYLLSGQEQVQVNDAISTKQSALKINRSYIPQKRHENNKKFIEEEILPEKSQPLADEKVESDSATEDKEPVMSEQEFIEVYERRNTEIRAFMERDLGLDPELASYYFELSKKRQKEVDDYLMPKMKSQEGPYLFSIDDNVAIANINARYVELLKSAMGEENYQSYQQFRNQMNRNSMEQDSDFPIWIEF
jgi:hypothetical protein